MACPGVKGRKVAKKNAAQYFWRGPCVPVFVYVCMGFWRYFILFFRNGTIVMGLKFFSNCSSVARASKRFEEAYTTDSHESDQRATSASFDLAFKVIVRIAFVGLRMSSSCSHGISTCSHYPYSAHQFSVSMQQGCY